MKLNSFLQLVGVLFTARAIFGTVYLFLGWQATIAGWVMPMWLMVVAVVVDALLACFAFKLVKK